MYQHGVMPNAANLIPGRKAKGGHSVRLSVYLYPDELEQLEKHLDMTCTSTYTRSREVARLLLQSLKSEMRENGTQ